LQHGKPAGGRCANDIGDNKSVNNEALFQYYGVINFLARNLHKKPVTPDSIRILTVKSQFPKVLDKKNTG
jgi:hypothetical protein